jgi:hypothetical protein
MVYEKREQKWITYLNKCNLVEDRTDYAACLKNAINFLVS